MSTWVEFNIWLGTSPVIQAVNVSGLLTATLATTKRKYTEELNSKNSPLLQADYKTLINQPTGLIHLYELLMWMYRWLHVVVVLQEDRTQQLWILIILRQSSQLWGNVWVIHTSHAGLDSHAHSWQLQLHLWHHVSGGVILRCHHLKHVTDSSTVSMSLVYCTANLFLNVK